jgi:hypothetical protein
MMDMDMVKGVLVDKGIETTRITRKPASREDMEALREQCSPSAFVVQQEELKFFTEFKGLVEDRGTKGKTSGLSKYLLGRKLIPVIEGDYETAGTLKNGVFKLLVAAQKKSDRNIYIVGVKKAIFLDFVKNFVEVKQRPNKTKQASTGRQDQGTVPGPNGNTL